MIPEAERPLSVLPTSSEDCLDNAAIMYAQVDILGGQKTERDTYTYICVRRMDYIYVTSDIEPYIGAIYIYIFEHRIFCTGPITHNCWKKQMDCIKIN
jgi:hypothetical protein